MSNTAERRAGNLRAHLAALVLAIVCLDVMAAVGLRLRKVRGPVSLDLRTAAPVFSHAFGVSLVPVRVATQFVKLGDPAPFALAVAAIAVLAFVGRDWLGGINALIGPPAAVLAAEHLKAHFGRTEGGGDAYPSGHTAALTALALVLGIAAWRRWGLRTLVVTIPLGLILSGGMVLTVVRLHDHLMSDAIGGVLLGMGVAVAVFGVLGTAAATSL